nr:MAG TPA: hypothetical protein [Caudoviricetes sp.]
MWLSRSIGQNPCSLDKKDIWEAIQFLRNIQRKEKLREDIAEKVPISTCKEQR